MKRAAKAAGRPRCSGRHLPVAFGLAAPVPPALELTLALGSRCGRGATLDRLLGNSSKTDLFLLGPSGLALELFTEQVQAATTITDVFQSELVQRQKSSPDAQVCESTTPATPKQDVVPVLRTVHSRQASRS